MRDDVAGHPGQDRIAVVPELALEHQRLQRLHRLREVEHRRPDLDHPHTLGEHSGGELGGLERIESKALDLNPMTALAVVFWAILASIDHETDRWRRCAA